MEYYLDSELIILGVKNYPCLYDPTHANSKHRELRRDAWMDVAKNVLGEEWDQMDRNKRSDVAKEVQKRWKSMKDCFFKSIKNDVGECGKDASKAKKKPYIHHKHMTFLQAAYERRENLRNGNTEVGKIEANEEPAVGTEEPAIVGGSCLQALLQKKRKKTLRIMNTEVINTEESEAPAVRTEEPAIVAAGPCSRIPSKRKNSDAFEEEILDVPKANLEQQPKKLIQDPDEMFLLSQLPHIKKMKPSCKLRFQIEFMQLIQKYSNPNQ